MPVNIKSLIFVLVLTLPVFAASKSTALIFTSESDFKRRRNIWVALTITAFLSPSFWLFAAIAAPLLYWGGAKDKNSLAFYLLLVNVIPPISAAIPPVLVNRIFNLDILRLMSFCVIVPAALRLPKTKSAHAVPGLKAMDFILLSFGALQVILFVPPATTDHIMYHNTVTNEFRTAFLYVIDIYTLYYVASRSCQDRATLLDALSALCLSGCIMAMIAVFEYAKHWLLYAGLTVSWGGDPMLGEYYLRGHLLRAEASTGQPLALAFLLVVALGAWLYLRSQMGHLFPKLAVPFLLCAGLLVTFSRGPWLAAVMTYFTFVALDVRGGSRLLNAALTLGLICALLLISPMGPKLVHMLPFMGGRVGAGDLTYREILLNRAWQLIKTHPILGDQLALWHMEDLRQGQGIIDVVNTYLSVTLFYGFVGLSLFLTFQVAPIARIRFVSRALRNLNLDMSRIGAALTAVIIGMAVLLFNSSLGGSPECVFYVMIGMACAYPAYLRFKESAPSPSIESDVNGSPPQLAPRA